MTVIGHFFFIYLQLKKNKMKNRKISCIEIENEDRNQIGSITLNKTGTLNPNDIFLKHFEIIELEDEILRLQFTGDDNYFDLLDVDETTTTLIELIKIETELDDIITDQEFEQIHQAIKQVLTPSF